MHADRLEPLLIMDDDWAEKAMRLSASMLVEAARKRIAEVEAERESALERLRDARMGVCRMDAPNGPECWCGQPSSYESGECAGHGRPPPAVAMRDWWHRVTNVLRMEVALGEPQYGRDEDEWRTAVFERVGPPPFDRDYAFRVALLARAEPELPIESVVFQASLPGRVVG